jgi:CBS domain-containing protein
MSLSESLDAFLRGHEEEAFPVVDGDQVIGLLTFESAGRVGRHDPLRPVRDAMLPLTEIPTAGLDEPLDAVSDRLAGRSAIVLSDGRLVGSLTPEDVGRWLLAHQPR